MRIDIHIKNQQFSAKSSSHTNTATQKAPAMPRRLTPEALKRAKTRAIKNTILRLQREIVNPRTPSHRIAPLSRAINESVHTLLVLEGVQTPAPDPAPKKRGRPYSKLPVRVERNYEGSLDAIYKRRIDGELKEIRITVPDSKGLSHLSRQQASVMTHGLLEAHIAAAAALGAAPVAVVPAAPPPTRTCAPLIDIHVPDCECKLDCGCLRRSVEGDLLGGQHRPDCPTKKAVVPPASPPPLTPRAYSEESAHTVPVAEVESKPDTASRPETIHKPDERIYPKPTASFDPVAGFGLRLSRKQ